MKFKLGFLIAALTLALGIKVYNSDNKLPSNELLDSKQDRLAEWNNERLQDPDLGKVPEDMGIREQLFAQTLPKREDATRSSGLFYSERGPFNIGGRTRGVAYDRTNLNTILAGGVNGGVWKSTNNGGTWTLTTDPDQMHNVTWIYQDPRSGKENEWYCTTGEGAGGSSGHHGSAPYQGNGMYKSTDGGNSWSLISSTSEDNPIASSDWNTLWNVVIDPSNSSQTEMYVAAHGSIYRSVDGGNNWVLELGNSNSSGYTWVGITSTGVVYAALGTSGLGQTNFGIWRSTDGQNWTNISSGVIPSNAQRIVFDIAPNDEDVLYFLMRTPGNGQPSDPNNPTTEYASLYRYEYRSGNGSGSGGSWSNRSSNIPIHQNTYYTFDTQGNYNMVVKINPRNKDIVYIGGTSLFRSTDGFSTTNNTTQIGGYNPKYNGNWEEYRYPEHHPDQHNIVFRGTGGSQAISTTDGGVHYTQDINATEVIWAEKNQGYVTTQFYTVAVDHKTENDVIIGGTQDNGTQFTRSNRASIPWETVLLADGSHCKVKPGNGEAGDGIYYMSMQNGWTFKVQMGTSGNKTAFQRFEYPGSDANYQFINPFTIDYETGTTMFMAFTNNSGQQIIKRNPILDQIPLANSQRPSATGWTDLTDVYPGEISVMRYSRSNPSNRMYVGTSTGILYRMDNATAASPVVTQLSTTFPYRKGVYVSDIAVHPDNADIVMMSFSNYNRYSIYYSTDAGQTWDGVAGNLEDPLPDGFPDAALGQGNGPSVRSIAMVKSDDGMTYYAGTSTGLYSTRKLEGRNTIWVQEASSEIGNNIVERMDVRDSDNYLAIATHGRGTFSTYVDYVSGIFTQDDLTSHFNALKAYPNPCFTNTTISFKTKEAQSLVAKVFTLSGKEVYQERIQSDSNGEGVHLISTENLNAGTYFVKVKGASFDKTIKLIKN